MMSAQGDRTSEFHPVTRLRQFFLLVAAILLIASACSNTDGPGQTGTSGSVAELPDSFVDTESTQAPVDFNHLSLAEIDVDLDYPTDVSPSGASLLVTERAGRVLMLTPTDSAGGYEVNQVLDITAAVGSTDSERGLLGVAAHPDGERFFLNYTRAEDGATVVAEYSLNPDGPDAGGAASHVRDLLVVEQPFSNHNGGDVAIGPDAMLYVGMGDGGAAGDPEGRAQNLDTNLGKILRLDPDSADARPADNPYDSHVWMRGTRNPWRISFDEPSGDLWIADVGQNRWEEITVIPAGSGGGSDLGWDRLEGIEEFAEAGPTADWPDDDAPRIDPVHVYSHDDGRCSISGGYVVRADGSPLHGLYVYSDYCDGRIRVLGRDGAAADTGLQLDEVISINADEQGNPLVLTPSGLFRIES